jgi:xanthine dehydrogenase small subunit
MAAVVARAVRTERALIGAAWSEASIVRASACLAEDFAPLSDLRASSAFRLQSARNLLRRFYVEHTQPGAATRTFHALAAAVPSA